MVAPMLREAALGERHFGRTSRRDAGWVSPALVFLGVVSFIVIPLKERVVDEAYDPLLRLWRRWRER